MNDHLRVARPTDDLEALVRMYREGLGLAVLGSFEDHDGFDGVMLGHPHASHHLEFTRQRGHRRGPAPSRDHLLVFYVPATEEWQRRCDRMESAGFVRVTSPNPYWERRGATFEDVDGYCVVLQNSAWPQGSRTGPSLEPGRGFDAALRRVNRLRESDVAGHNRRLAVGESIMDDLFGAGRRLAVYGSLAPGQINHRIVEPVGGDWSQGTVRGRLRTIGWGADAGYPGMSWDPAGEVIPVQLLVSVHLEEHWPRLDEFEGPRYRRILVPVETASGVTVANIYEVRV